MSLNSGLKHCLESVIANVDVQGHPYFNLLASGEMSKTQFLISQIEFAPLVQCLNLPMAQVINGIPNALLRMSLVEHLWDEHNKAGAEKAHSKTMLILIERLGGNPALISSDRMTPNIRIFNEALRGVSAFADGRFAAGMFGGIERTLADVSTIICKAMIDQKWLSSDRITHYNPHKELTIQHAEDFLQVVNHDWDNPMYQKTIKDGIEFGANLFLNVYTDLYHTVCRSMAFPESKIA